MDTQGFEDKEGITGQSQGQKSSPFFVERVAEIYNWFPFCRNRQTSKHDIDILKCTKNTYRFKW